MLKRLPLLAPKYLLKLKAGLLGVRLSGGAGTGTGTGGPPPPAADNLLMESGSILLLEDGSKILLE